MKDVKAGTYIVVTEGEYSSYMVYGLYKVVKPIKYGFEDDSRYDCLTHKEVVDYLKDGSIVEFEYEEIWKDSKGMPKPGWSVDERK